MSATVYTQELADRIFDRIAAGESARTACDAEDVGRTTFHMWLRTKQDFRRGYDAAVAARADAFGEDMLDVANDGRNDWMEKHGKEDAGWVANGENIQRSKLRIDTMKWNAARMQPKKYGDKLGLTADVSLTQTGPDLSGLSNIEKDTLLLLLEKAEQTRKA